jgi:hypothetical protein
MNNTPYGIFWHSASQPHSVVVVIAKATYVWGNS